MHIPGTPRPPRRPFEWQQLPTPEPTGVDTSSKEALIGALKSNGYLSPEATCDLSGIPERLHAPMLASVLYMAQEFPEPFLLNPLTDICTAGMGDQTPTIANFLTFENAIVFNSDHKLLTDMTTGLKPEIVWERFTNYVKGCAIHECAHKTQLEHKPDDKRLIDDAIATEMDDWRAPYPNAFPDVGEAFLCVYGRYGRQLAIERDAMAIQFYAHGLKDDYGRAIFDAYKFLHGPHRLLDQVRPLATPVGHTNEPSTNERVRVGTGSVGMALRHHGDTFRCDNVNVYYFRCGTRRFMLSNGYLVDVDQSVKSGHPVATRLETDGVTTNTGVILEQGAPPARISPNRVEPRYLPKSFVTGQVTEAVALSRGRPLALSDADRQALSTGITSSGLVESIQRDLIALKTTRFTPIPADEHWPFRSRDGHTIAWQVPVGSMLEGLEATLPHAQRIVIQTSMGLDIRIPFPRGKTSVNGRDTKGIRVTDPFDIGLDELATSIAAGRPLVLTDKAGVEHDYGHAERIAIAEESPVPAAELLNTTLPATIRSPAIQAL